MRSDLQVLHWPLTLPDLNLIEYVWDMLQSPLNSLHPIKPESTGMCLDRSAYARNYTLSSCLIWGQFTLSKYKILI